MKFLYLFTLLPVFAIAQYDGNTTPNYPQLIQQFKEWDEKHEEILLLNFGESDTEFPIYLCLINAGFDSVSAINNAKFGTTVLINNAIHPGEPDGVNASLIWIQNWIKGGKKTRDLPIIAIIPAYNIGGMMNRSGTSRANQDGPVEYGFRGNAQNLDLNRDFIKMDSPNARTFSAIFQALDPDVFVDNHVSDGADYQYTLTLISSLKDRLSPSQKLLTTNEMLPELTKALKTKKIDWAPYVDTKGETPDSGIVAFNDLPRYAMGYARLFNALSFTVETHMLKPFPERVQANLVFMDELFRWTGKNKGKIEKAKLETIQFQKEAGYFKHHFETTENFEMIEFKGYEAKHKPSEITGTDRLYYDRTKPFTRNVKYFNQAIAIDSSKIPTSYIVSKEAEAIIEMLKANGVEMTEISGRKEMTLTTVRIESYKSRTTPYEGHFLHHSVVTSEQTEKVEVPAGSYQISTNQKNCNFIVSVLEAETEDSYFAWNFMDSYIQEKEYFSDYVFEDIALEILKNEPALKAKLEEEKKNNVNLMNDSWGQLYFIYKHSNYFENKTFNRLPVFKMY